MFGCGLRGGGRVRSWDDSIVEVFLGVVREQKEWNLFGGMWENVGRKDKFGVDGGEG